MIWKILQSKRLIQTEEGEKNTKIQNKSSDTIWDLSHVQWTERGGIYHPVLTSYRKFQE